METTEQDTKCKTVTINNELIDNTSQQHPFWLRFGTKAAIYTGTTALVGLYGVPVLFSWIGFSSIGVTASSWAAWWQSTQYIPGIFGVMQSVTATGAASAVVTKCGASVALVKAYYDAKKKQSEKETNPKQELSSKL